MTKIATGVHPDLKMVNPAAAAIDIGSTMHMAAVNPAACDTPVRAFRTFTQDLHDLADWFEACGVTSVAMESTGVYWIPAFEVLEARGFEVILVNARYAKNVLGRKTDVSDAGWLRQLHSYGLLRGSFRPAAEIATLRAYLRQRERLVEYAAANIQHMQKALPQRPRQPILFARLPEYPARTCLPSIDERQGQLLRQCGRRDLLQDHQGRVDLAQDLGNAPPSRDGHLPIHQRLL